MMPGIYPKRVNKIFSQKAPLMPTARKTPNGGRMMANIRRKMLILADTIIVVNVT